jgi:hypothetical protein
MDLNFGADLGRAISRHANRGTVNETTALSGHHGRATELKLAALVAPRKRG